MQRAYSLEKTLMVGKIEGRRRREQQKMSGWMAPLTQWTWVWAGSGRWWRTGKPGVLQSIGSQTVGYNLATKQQLMLPLICMFSPYKNPHFDLKMTCMTYWDTYIFLEQNVLGQSVWLSNIWNEDITDFLPWKWKSWLKAQHSENEDHGIRSHHFMGNRWGNSGNSVRLYFGGLQNHCRWWLQPWN